MLLQRVKRGFAWTVKAARSRAELIARLAEVAGGGGARPQTRATATAEPAATCADEESRMSYRRKPTRPPTVPGAAAPAVGRPQVCGVPVPARHTPVVGFF